MQSFSSACRSTCSRDTLGRRSSTGFCHLPMVSINPYISHFAFNRNEFEHGEILLCTLSISQHIQCWGCSGNEMPNETIIINLSYRKRRTQTTIIMRATRLSPSLCWAIVLSYSWERGTHQRRVGETICIASASASWTPFVLFSVGSEWNGYGW